MCWQFLRLYRVIFLENCEKLLGDIVVAEGVLHGKVELVPTNVPEKMSEDNLSVIFNQKQQPTSKR